MVSSQWRKGQLFKRSFLCLNSCDMNGSCCKMMTNMSPSKMHFRPVLKIWKSGFMQQLNPQYILLLMVSLARLLLCFSAYPPVLDPAYKLEFLRDMEMAKDTLDKHLFRMKKIVSGSYTNSEWTLLPYLYSSSPTRENMLLRSHNRLLYVQMRTLTRKNTCQVCSFV